MNPEVVLIKKKGHRLFFNKKSLLVKGDFICSYEIFLDPVGTLLVEEGSPSESELRRTLLRGGAKKIKIIKKIETFSNTIY